MNMAMSEKLNLDRDTYSASIPLGATINMAGAAITITVLTLAAVNTLGVPVDLYPSLRRKWWGVSTPDPAPFSPH